MRTTPHPVTMAMHAPQVIPALRELVLVELPKIAMTAMTAPMIAAIQLPDA